MSNLSDPDELADSAAEITVPETDGTGGPDRPARPGTLDPSVRGSETAAEPLPQDNAEQLESALRDGAGFLRIADEHAEARRRLETEEGPGTSVN
ncbi:MAG: hypothetical protein ACJ73E_12590 [Mycobacteriales bacterium]